MKTISPMEAMIIVLTLLVSSGLAAWQVYYGAVDMKPFAVWVGGTMTVILMVQYRIITYLVGFLTETKPMVTIIKEWLNRMS